MDPMLLLLIVIFAVVLALFPIVLGLRLMCLACRALELYIKNREEEHDHND